MRRTVSEQMAIPAGDFALGDGVVAHALDAGLVAGGTRGQALVAAVLAQAAAVAGAHVAEGARGRGRGRRGGLDRRGRRVRGRGLVRVMCGLVQGALEAAHQGAWQDFRGVGAKGAAQAWQGRGGSSGTPALC